METITIVFTGEDNEGRAKCQMIQSKNCNKYRLSEGAQALMYMAAIKSENGFEKEIEIITEKIMHSKAQRIQ